MLKGISRSEEDTKETGRIEAFSDGVFAIAITLLILEVKVPHDIEEGHLGDALGKLWPSFAAFVFGFLFILVMWVNHHRMFEHIKRSDTGLLVINGLFLMGVTFMPFPTALLAEYLPKGSSDQATAVLFNSVAYFVMALFFNALWWYSAYRGRLLSRRVNTKVVQAINRSYFFGPPVYLIAVLLAFVNVWASLALNLFLALFFLLPNPLMAKLKVEATE